MIKKAQDISRILNVLVIGVQLNFNRYIKKVDFCLTSTKIFIFSKEYHKEFGNDGRDQTPPYSQSYPRILHMIQKRKIYRV